MNDVVISKTASIQRCVKRAREERAESEDFENDFTRQDAAVLNVTRACEQAIDLANHVIREQKLGIPRDSGESFELLAGAGYLDRPLAMRLRKMVGFRNTVVHQYQDVEIEIVIAVIDRGLDDLLTFTASMLDRFG